MITVKSLKAILDSIEQSTGNPETVIRFNLDHGEEIYHEEPPRLDWSNQIQSVNISAKIDIDPKQPEPSEMPLTTCVITLE